MPSRHHQTVPSVCDCWDESEQAHKQIPLFQSCHWRCFHISYKWSVKCLSAIPTPLPIPLLLSCHVSNIIPYPSTLASSSVWPRWRRQLHYTHSSHQAPFLFLCLLVQFDSRPNLLSNYANEFIVGGSPSWLSRDSDSLGTGGQKVCSAHVWQFDRSSTEREQGRRERKNLSTSQWAPSSRSCPKP